MPKDKDTERLLKKFSDSKGEQSKKDVLKVARYFFDDVDLGKGSHEILIRSELFSEVPDNIVSYNNFSIPVKRGNKVKPLYCRRLVKIIQELRKLGKLK